MPLAPLAEWILWDLRRTQEVLHPHVPEGAFHTHYTSELRLQLPDGEVTYILENNRLRRLWKQAETTTSWSRRGIRGGFQLRSKLPRGAVVRVRLANSGDFLLTAGRVGGAPPGVELRQFGGPS
jgi:hypothetical protein